MSPRQVGQLKFEQHGGLCAKTSRIVWTKRHRGYLLAVPYQLNQPISGVQMFFHHDSVYASCHFLLLMAILMGLD
jgi:hypothetical protein